MRIEKYPGYYTAQETLRTLGITQGVLYSLVRQGILHRYTPPGKKYGIYKQEEVDLLAAERAVFVMAGLDVTHRLSFAQATVDDMEGITTVGKQAIGGRVLSADERRALVSACPIGNYVVKDNGRIVAYIQFHPLRHDRLMAFVHGKIRGWDITADDITGFTPGQPVECLIMGVAAYHPDKAVRIRYVQRLLAGTAHELAKLGEQGIQLTTMYSTSESETGIALSLHAHMHIFAILKGSEGKKRFAFCLDVATSDLPILQPYKAAYAAWQRDQAEAGAAH